MRPDFAPFQQEVQHAVVQIAGTEGFHAAHADAVQQEVVDVVQFAGRGRSGDTWQGTLRGCACWD